MIQAKLIEIALKALLKSDVFKSLVKYKDEPNSADLAVIRLEELAKSASMKHYALIDIVKGYSEQFDKMQESLKFLEKTTKSYEDKIHQLEKINKYFDKMKKLPLLKSIFK